MDTLLALLAAAVTVTGLAPTAPAAAQDDPEAIVRRADAALDELAALEAEFVQRVENPILERTEIGHGTLVYRAPDRFRIEYRYPEGDVVVNDGRYVWIYLPSSQPDQVIRQPAAASGVRNPMTYLRDLRDGYEVSLEGAEEVSGEPVDHLVLTPASSDTPFARLDVWVERDRGLVRQVRTRTADDVVTTYTFQTLRTGIAVVDELFRFTPPEGVEVYDA